MPEPPNRPDDRLGPIEFPFPDGEPTCAGFDVAPGLADRDAMRVLDSELASHGAHGAGAMR